MQLADAIVLAFPGIAATEGALVGQLARISRVLTVAADSILCQQGAATDCLHWLLDGQMALVQSGPSLGAAVIDVVRPVAGITVAGAVLGEAYPITAQALAPSRVLEVRATPLRHLSQQKPLLAIELMRGMARETASAVWQIVDLKTRKAAQRLGNYLLTLVEDPEAVTAEFRLPFQKGILAAKLGCRQENLSRAFASLRQLGVETHGLHVRLSDIPRLQAFSGAGAPGAGGRVEGTLAEMFSSAFRL
jgi:CRP/FNR family transcriptional regulator, transcriptional activator FtrB